MKPSRRTLSSIVDGPDASEIQKMSLTELYKERGVHSPRVAELIDAEIRRRERWDTPATRALWISLGALSVSIASLFVAWFK